MKHVTLTSILPRWSNEVSSYLQKLSLSSNALKTSTKSSLDLFLDKIGISQWYWQDFITRFPDFKFYLYQGRLRSSDYDGLKLLLRVAQHPNAYVTQLWDDWDYVIHGDWALGYY